MTRRCTAWMPCRVGRSLVRISKVLAELEARGVHLTKKVSPHVLGELAVDDYVVRLVSTVPRYGGRRWWFLYPLARNDGRRRAASQTCTFPLAAVILGAGRGYGLTYRSSQENARGLFKRLAAQKGRTRHRSGPRFR